MNFEVLKQISGYFYVDFPAGVLYDKGKRSVMA